MKNHGFKIGIGFIAVMWLCGGGWTLATTPEETRRDLQRLEDLREQLRSGAFEEFNPYMSFSGDDMWTQYEQVLDKYKAFKDGQLQELERVLEDFSNKYGSDGEVMDQTITDILGKFPDRRPSWIYKDLSEGLEKMKAYPKEMAKKLLDIEIRNMEHMDDYAPQIREKKFDESKRALDLAVQFDPQNDTARDHLDAIGKKRKEALAAVEKQIDEKKWLPHSPKFNGPGNPNALAAEVKKFLSVDDQGKKTDEVLAVRISGDWRVAEETLLGPKNFGLPVEVAFKIKDEPQNAKVLVMTIVTRDAKMAPPFQTYWVGDNWRIRRSRLPGEGGSGGANILFRLFLSVALVLCGLLAAAPLLKAKLTFLKAPIDAIAPLRSIIGVATLVLGVVLFIFSLLSPFRDLLPQLAAMVTGLLLGLELLLKPRAKMSTAGPAASSPPPLPGAPPPVPAGAGPAPPPLPDASGPPPLPQSGDPGQKVADAAQKAQDFLRRHEQQVRRLEAFQIPIGIICLVLALLHLIAGGVILF